MAPDIHKDNPRFRFLMLCLWFAIVAWAAFTYSPLSLPLILAAMAAGVLCAHIGAKFYEMKIARDIAAADKEARAGVQRTLDGLEVPRSSTDRPVKAEAVDFNGWLKRRRTDQ